MGVTLRLEGVHALLPTANKQRLPQLMGGILDECKFAGEWRLSVRATLKCSGHTPPFKFVKVEHGGLQIKCKPGDNSSGAVCLLFPPPNVSLKTAEETLRRWEEGEDVELEAELPPSGSNGSELMAKVDRNGTKPLIENLPPPLPIKTVVEPKPAVPAIAPALVLKNPVSPPAPPPAAGAGLQAVIEGADMLRHVLEMAAKLKKLREHRADLEKQRADLDTRIAKTIEEEGKVVSAIDTNPLYQAIEAIEAAKAIAQPVHK